MCDNRGVPAECKYHSVDSQSLLTRTPDHLANDYPVVKSAPAFFAYKSIAIHKYLTRITYYLPINLE